MNPKPRKRARRAVLSGLFVALGTGFLGGTVFLPGCSKFASRSTAPGPVMTDEGVAFRYYAPGASRVQLAGNWPENNWARGDGSVGEADVGLMAVDDNGMWQIVVPLGPGRYYYVFWVDDNRWRTDPGNPEETDFGPAGRSSVLVVFLQGGELEIR